MARAHDTGLRHPKAEDQVVSPQRDVTVPTARGAGLLCIHRVTGESFQKEMLLDPFWRKKSKQFLTGNLRVEF